MGRKTAFMLQQSTATRMSTTPYERCLRLVLCDSMGGANAQRSPLEEASQDFAQLVNSVAGVRAGS